MFCSQFVDPFFFFFFVVCVTSKKVIIIMSLKKTPLPLIKLKAKKKKKMSCILQYCYRYRSASFSFPLIHLQRRFCSLSSSSSSSVLRNELSAFFSSNQQHASKISIRDLAGKLSDDAFDELGETSLKEWITTNMHRELAVIRDDCAAAGGEGGSVFCVVPVTTARQLPQQPNLVHVLTDAPPPPALHLHEKKKQKHQQQNIAVGFPEAPPAPTPSSSAKEVELSAVPAPDLWEKFAVQQQTSRSYSADSTINAAGIVLSQETAASERQRRGQENEGKARASDLLMKGKHILFCLPTFVVPLCHETMDILEEQIGRMVPDVEQDFFKKQNNGVSSTSSSRTSPLSRFQAIFQASSASSSASSNSSFFAKYEIDEFGAELVRLESFAPSSKAEIQRWIEEEKLKHDSKEGEFRINRVDNLIPESIHLRVGQAVQQNARVVAEMQMMSKVNSSNNAAASSNKGNEIGEKDDQSVDEDDAREDAAQISTSDVMTKSRELHHCIVDEPEIVVPSSSSVPDFELPTWIAEHVDAEGAPAAAPSEAATATTDKSTSTIRYRYFFRLSPIYHNEKQEASVKLYYDNRQQSSGHQQQQQHSAIRGNENGTSPLDVAAAAVNPFFNDSVFSEFQVLEYDAFRLARCLPPSGTSISLKNLVIGGVLNVLSVPDVQLVITSFPEMFEYPVKFDAVTEQAVRFILAGSYDKPIKRSVAEIRAEINSLGDVRKSKVDPKTGQKLKGGQWMRLFDKSNKLNKELALALNPGAHPLKDPRVLAQLLFDMLPLDEPVELSTMHKRLKTTAVQLGENLDIAFFRKFPHMFFVVELGNAEKFGIVRADAAVPDFLLNPKPNPDEQMWSDIFAAFRRLVKNRDTVAMSLLTMKVATGSRLRMEELVLAQSEPAKREERAVAFKKKLPMIGVAFVDEIAVKQGIFEVVSRQGIEIFIRIRPEHPTVQKYMDCGALSGGKF